MTRASTLLMSIALVCLTGIASAKPWWLHGVESNDADFLPPDVAFRVGAQADGRVVKVRWVIADGYYLYRSKISVTAASADLVVFPVSLPRGSVKTDPYLGTNEVFTQQVEGTVPYRRIDYGAHPLQIKVSYQGCAEAGLCYPVITKVLFPTTPPSITEEPPARPFEGAAILGGAFAFLLAGFLLRKGRKLDTPAA
jgi:thioredoxin:protein disulfide reductase